MPTRSMATSFKELSSRTWKDFETLMGPKGGCGGCWCMSWRVPRSGKYWESVKGETNKKTMKRLVDEGKAHGIIAYDGGSPVGWCSMGPRDHFLRLKKTKAYVRADEKSVWSIPCFYIRKDWRGHGLSTQLLQQAVVAAGKRGASLVEGCPVTKTKEGKILPPASQGNTTEVKLVLSVNE